MTVSHRAKVLSIIFLVLIAILIALFFLLRRGPEENVAPVDTYNEDLTPNKTVVESTDEPLVIEPEAPVEASAEVVAKIFAERFGSYSSDSNLANLEDVLSLCASNYRAELENTIEKSRADNTTSDYYGVSTRVLSVKADEQSETSAKLSILTQREEARGSVSNTSIKYQTLVLTMVKQDGVWKVQSATWQD